MTALHATMPEGTTWCVPVELIARIAPTARPSCTVAPTSIQSRGQRSTNTSSPTRSTAGTWLGELLRTRRGLR
jgi:hypothetical protein